MVDDDSPKIRIKQAEDTILRIRSNTVCGPDLHLIMRTLRPRSQGRPDGMIP